MQTLHILIVALSLPAPQDPFMKYQVGAPYEALRKFNGRLFGVAGRTIFRLLQWWNSKVLLPVCQQCARMTAGTDMAALLQAGDKPAVGAHNGLPGLART